MADKPKTYSILVRGFSETQRKKLAAAAGPRGMQAFAKRALLKAAGAPETEEKGGRKGKKA